MTATFSVETIGEIKKTFGKLNKLFESIFEKTEKAPVAETEPENNEPETDEEKEAPEATGTVATTTRKGSRGGVNRSELIRECLKKHNMEIKNKDLIDLLKKEHKVEVGPSHVSIVRKQMQSEGGKAKAKKEKAKAKKSPVAKAVASKKDLKGLPMTALVTKIVGKKREGLKLGEIGKAVIDAGYEYHGNKGPEGIVQNVYQALLALRRKTNHPGYEGKVAVILHDPISKRYRLNPKAKAKKVA